jgi:hypothetical protein
MMSRETQISELMGSCVLRSPESSSRDAIGILEEVKNLLRNIGLSPIKKTAKELISDVTDLIENPQFSNIQSVLQGALFLLYGMLSKFVVKLIIFVNLYTYIKE